MVSDIEVNHEFFTIVREINLCYSEKSFEASLSLLLVSPFSLLTYFLHTHIRGYREILEVFRKVLKLRSVMNSKVLERKGNAIQEEFDLREFENA